MNKKSNLVRRINGTQTPPTPQDIWGLVRAVVPTLWKVIRGRTYVCRTLTDSQVEMLVFLGGLDGACDLKEASQSMIAQANLEFQTRKNR